jgi:hypothetical protein
VAGEGVFVAELRALLEERGLSITFHAVAEEG